MAVSANYLEKLRRAVKRNQSPNVDAEVTDIIEECRQDLINSGVSELKASSEEDSSILGAVRCFARWKCSQSIEESNANKNDYLQLKDELRKNPNYSNSEV